MLQSIAFLFGGIFVGRGLLSSQKPEHDFPCLIKTPETPDQVVLFVLQWYTDVAAAVLKANSGAACIGVKVFSGVCHRHSPEATFQAKTSPPSAEYRRRQGSQPLQRQV